jgi:hypothetical protein
MRAPPCPPGRGTLGSQPWSWYERPYVAREAMPPDLGPYPSDRARVAEIKHDGFRTLAVRDGERVRLVSRRGLDWGEPFGIARCSLSPQSTIFST